MNPPTHYEVLGLSPSADATEIGRRADELLKLYGSDSAQSSMTRLIDEAKRVLTSPVLRSIYDQGSNKEPDLVPILPEIESPLSAAPPVKIAEEVTMSHPVVIEQEKTVAIPEPTDADVPSDAKIAHELARRGVSQDEVRRLMAMGIPSAPAKGKVKPKPASLADMIPESKSYVPHPTITLPAFRESSGAERVEADRLLTGANIARRRGKFQDAEHDCRAAVLLVPKDGSALEMYGDILQAIGKVDDALFAYNRAVEADPKRSLAEKKYAELMLLQNREIDMLREEFLPRNATVAVLISSLFPGAGQIYNGDTIKGIFLMVSDLGIFYLLGWTPYGFHKGPLSAPLVIMILLAGGLYIYGVIDAYKGAQRGRKMGSGWDV